MAEPWATLGGFDTLGGFGRAAPLAPKLDPEEERSTLAALGEQSLGGLSYLGKIADKTFGARAIRGVLGGNARELLSVLPGSDTLGLTDEKDVVTGRKLAQNLGLTGAGDPNSFDSGDALGIGIELALDPSTYLGFGTLTRGGQIAAKAGARLPGRTSAKIAGFAARESDVAAHALNTGKTQLAAMADLGLKPTDSILSQAAEQAGRAANVPIEPQRILNGAGLIDNPNAATPLAGALGIGAPFGIGGRTPLLTGRSGQVVSDLLPYNLGTSLAGKAADATEAATGFNPVRTVKGLFNTPSKGAGTAAGQALHETLTTPLEDKLATQALGESAGLAQQLRPFQAQGPDAARLAGRRATLIAEESTRATPVPYAPGQFRSAYAERVLPQLEQQLAGAGFTPAQIAGLDATAEAAGQRLQPLVGGQRALGVNAAPLQDITGYFTRQKEVLPRQPGESWVSYQIRRAQNYAARSASTGQRDDVFRLVPGGTDQINSWARDPALVAQARTAPRQAARTVFGQLMDNRGLTEQVPYVAEEIDKRFAKSGQRLIDRRVQDLLALGPQPQSVMDAVPADIRGELARQTVKGLLRKQSRNVADLLGTIPDERAAAGLGYFSDDFLGGFRTALERDAKVRAAATSGLEGIARNLVPHLGDDTTKSVASLLAELKLDGRAAGTGRQVAMDLLADRTGQTAAQLDKMGVPKAFASDLLRTNAPWENPGELKPALAAWDALTQAFKTGVTTPFPSFHVRNLSDALFGQLNDSAVSAGAHRETYNLLRGGEMSAGQAAKLFPGLSPAEATAAFERELLSHPATYSAGSLSRDTVGQLGERIASNPGAFNEATGRSLLGDAAAGVGDIAKTIPEAYTAARSQGAGRARAALDSAAAAVKAPVAAGAAVGDLAENQGRISHFLALRNQGFSADAAAERVGLIQRDYSDLTNFERQVMRRIMPFYSFTRRNAASLADQVGTAPGRLAGTLRVTQSGHTPGEFVPPYIAEGAAIPLGRNADGTQRFVSSFGLPIEDELVKGLANLAHGDVTRAVQTGLGQTQPYIKSPLEFAFGTQLYSGRKLDELTASPTLSALLPEVAARKATQVIANTPASRVLSSVDRLLDPRKGTGVSLSNLLTGTRVQDVDAERQQPVATRRLLEGALRGSPGIRSADTLFLQKAAVEEGRVPEEVLKLYRAYLDQQKLIEENSKKPR